MSRRYGTVVRALALLLPVMTTMAASGQPAQRERVEAPQRGSHGDMDQLVDTGWEVHALHAKDHPEADVWRPATVPGVTLTDLLAAKVIGDPYYRDNEKSLQWIGLSDWEYRRTLQVTAAQLAHAHVELVFDGLDTFADVYVNGTQVLTANNMFRRWRVDVKQRLHPGENQLRVVFHSPITTMMPKVKAMQHPLPTVVQVQAVSEEGIATDPYVRKAPYSYGWDWGPRFVNEGIWKDVHLVGWDAVRVEHLHIAQPHVDASAASLVAEMDVFADHAMTATLQVQGRLLRDDQATGAAAVQGERTVQLFAGENHLLLPMVLERPQLWWPVGYGAQNRYVFDASLTAPGLHALASVKTGIRSIELRRAQDAIGRSFTFIVNGVPVFAKGADVIPFDSFAPRVTEAAHRRILTAAVAAHMNMIRAWGGGYYESDDFYDLCDQLGLMVWQEFMFGGAQIPSDTDVPGFRENVQQEAIEQVDRLRDHPSIVLWCGNNEVETGWYHWGDRIAFRKSLTKDEQQKVWQDYLLVMDDVLGGAVAAHDPQVPYTPSSPHADYEHIPDIQTAGDMHYWAVWGQSIPVATYNQITPRFMSEFGFQSFPSMRTIATFATPADEQLNSPVMMAHQKNNGGNGRIKTYMDAEYPAPKDFASFVYLSQIQQAEAIRVAVDHLRSARPRTMGALYWQLNDSWPGPSWSSIDYDGRWKALQFYAKRFYADVNVAPYLHDGVVDTSLINDLEHPIDATLTVTTMSFDGAVYATSSQRYTVAAASAQQVAHTSLATLLGEHSKDSTLARYVLAVGGKPVAERTLYFDAVKNLALPKAQIEASWSQHDGHLFLTLRSDRLARNVEIRFDGMDAELSDNYFDLLPHVPVTIMVSAPASAAELQAKLRTMSLRDAFAADDTATTAMTQPTP